MQLYKVQVLICQEWPPEYTKLSSAHKLVLVFVSGIWGCLRHVSQKIGGPDFPLLYKS